MYASQQTALRSAPEANSGEPSQYLIFTLNGESFAMDILQIREIIEFGHLTEVPMTPETVRGVINLRGAVVPVIDLSARFDRGQTAVGRRTCIVILEIDDGEALQTVGIVVDGVTEVLEIAAADIEPPPAFGARMRTDFIAGMARLGERFVIILDLASVLSLAELAQLAEPGDGSESGAMAA
ncbi:MAG: chemotaxis protein CheW [Rhodocyclaceae bacterium]